MLTVDGYTLALAIRRLQSTSLLPRLADSGRPWRAAGQRYQMDEACSARRAAGTASRQGKVRVIASLMQVGLPSGARS